MAGSLEKRSSRGHKREGWRALCRLGVGSTVGRAGSCIGHWSEPLQGLLLGTLTSELRGEGGGGRKDLLSFLGLGLFLFAGSLRPVSMDARGQGWLSHERRRWGGLLCAPSHCRPFLKGGNKGCDHGCYGNVPPQLLEVVRTVLVEGSLEAGGVQRAAEAVPETPGTHMDAESLDGRKDGASSPERRRDRVQSPRWPERKVDGGGGGEEPPMGGRARTPAGRCWDRGAWQDVPSQCETGVRVGYFGDRSHTFAVRSSSSGCCRAAWLSLPWRLPWLLRSGTRHTVAKQPEAGYLEGTGGALALPIPGGQ